MCTYDNMITLTSKVLEPFWKRNPPLTKQSPQLLSRTSQNHTPGISVNLLRNDVYERGISKVAAFTCAVIGYSFGVLALLSAFGLCNARDFHLKRQ